MSSHKPDPHERKEDIEEFGDALCEFEWAGPYADPLESGE